MYTQNVYFLEARARARVSPHRVPFRELPLKQRTARLALAINAALRISRRN